MRVEIYKGLDQPNHVQESIDFGLFFLNLEFFERPKFFELIFKIIEKLIQRLNFLKFFQGVQIEIFFNCLFCRLYLAKISLILVFGDSFDKLKYLMDV